jgi:type IV fimbrial biogenesis protein FimT
MRAIALERTWGFTLWELLYVVTIASVVLGLGVPALRDVVLDARRLSAVNSLVAAARFARNEAQKRGRPVVLCPSADRRICTGELDFGNGWIVFENSDGDRPAQRSSDELLLHIGEPGAMRAITANRTAFEFRPFPRRSTNGTIDFCDPRGDVHSRAVVVSYTGRPRITDLPRGRCPEAG